MYFKLNDKLKILIVSQSDNGVEAALRSIFDQFDIFIDLVHANSIETGIEAVVTNTPDISFVDDVDRGTLTRDLLIGLEDSGFKNELGINNSIVAVVGLQDIDIEKEIIELGGKGIITNSFFPEVMRMVIHSAAELKQVKINLRADKDSLIRQLFEMQDSRDRESELAYDHVGMADELSLVKEELENAIHDKNRLFTIIAHDLRTPFVPLLAYTEMLSLQADQLPVEKVKEFAGDIHTAGCRIHRLLENLLDWSIVEMDYMNYKPKVLQIRDVAVDVMQFLEPAAGEKNIKLVMSLNENTAYFDANMISTVLRNLISNSIKFSNDNSQIKIYQSNNTDLDSEYLEVTIRDQGIGMSQDISDLLFSRKGSKKSKGTKGEPGSGIGLFLCKEMINRNGGKIRVNSELGKGSEFTISLVKNPPISLSLGT